MPHTFTRQELYDLVWSEPMRNLAGKYTISDRGLAKACVAANIPVPERGYWNKLQAGKKTSKKPLPPRGMGQSDEVTIGGNSWGYYRESDTDLLNNPIPPPPVFEVSIETIRAQATAIVNKAPLPKTIGKTHRLIAKLLANDEVRLQKYLASQYPSSWDAPIFNTPFETRRLKILNGLFTCLEYCGMKPSVSGKQGRDLMVIVGDKRISFSLDTASAEKQLERERVGYGFEPRGNKDKMRLALTNWHSQQKDCQSWQDTDDGPIEDHLREIVIELIVSGEESYRSGLIRHREWQVERKAQLQEEERKRKAEEERKRKEQQAKLEKQRIDHLLGQANALHQAAQIRAYVAAIQDANKTAPQPMSPEELTAWRQWALGEADRIDPIVSGAYRTRPAEPKE